VGKGLEAKTKYALVGEIMPGMECLSGRNERITGSRLSKSGLIKSLRFQDEI